MFRVYVKSHENLYLSSVESGLEFLGMSQNDNNNNHQSINQNNVGSYLTTNSSGESVDLENFH